MGKADEMKGKLCKLKTQRRKQSILEKVQFFRESPSEC